MATKTCKQCGNEFETFVKIDGKQKNLVNRSNCLICKPFSNEWANLCKSQYDFKAEGRKQCSNCKIIKTTEDFTKRLSGGNSYSHVCKECTKSIRLQNKIELINYKGGKCKLCGYNKCIDALEFHHTDPTKKEFELSAKLGMKIETLKKEVDNCNLLCANCHREEHWRLKQVNEIK